MLPASEEPQPTEDSRDGIPEWVGRLIERLATDEDFRRQYERTPGKAAHSIGVPYDEFVAHLARTGRKGDGDC